MDVVLVVVCRFNLKSEMGQQLVPLSPLAAGALIEATNMNSPSSFAFQALHLSQLFSILCTQVFVARQG